MAGGTPLSPLALLSRSGVTLELPAPVPLYSPHLCAVRLWHVCLYKFLLAGFIKYPLGEGLGGDDPDAQEEMFHISRSAVCAPRQPLPPAYQL